RTKKQKMICRVGEGIWNGLNVKPSTHYFQRDTSMASVDESFGKPVVTIGLPEKKFLTFDVRSERNLQRQNIVASLDAYTEYNYPEHTLKPPFIRQLNEFYSREITMDPWVLRIEKDGIGLIKAVTENSLHLYPVQHQALIEKIFQLAGIKAKMSQPG